VARLAGRDAGLGVAHARLEQGAREGQRVALEVELADRQRVVNVQVDHAPGVAIEAEPVLDRRVAGREPRIEALEALRGEHRLGGAAGAARHQQVEVRVARERRREVLVALEVAVRHGGALEGFEQREQGGERCGLARGVQLRQSLHPRSLRSRRRRRRRA
jgi:hypothetical protein